MGGGTWQTLVDNGMMIWKPTTSAVDDTQQALSQSEFTEAEIQDQLRSSYQDDRRTSVLPSVEVSTTTSFKVEKQFPSKTRPLSEQYNHNLFSETLNFTPPSSALPDCSWHDQLEAFAASGNSTSTLAKSPNTSISCNAGYASDSTDRTDFFPNSPCPGVRTLQITGSQKGFRVKTAMKSDSVVRRLDFGNKVTNSTTTDIGALERSPRHGWTSSERIFLCTIFRWYERDTHAFAQIFNAVHNLELPMHKIRDQFECYIRLHGGRAVPEYHQVFEATHFSDLTGRYMLVRERIEETARVLGIEIRRLEHEVTSPSGEAARAKSVLTRRRHRALLKISKRKAAARTAATADNENNDNNTITNSLTAVKRTAAAPLTVGGFSLATSDPQDMFLSDAEDSASVASMEGRPMVHDDHPCLLFRVWDASSRTLFGPDGFISSGFVEWTDIPPPIPPNDPHKVFKLLAHLHLSRVGDTPCFIAAAESLIQVLTIAANLHEPKIAIIDLRAPCMQQDHKTHLASATLKWLKKDGKIKLRYRYQGHGDWFSYATIPKEAILKHFKLEDLHDTCSHDSAAARLMNLEAFQPGLKTREVASAMRNRKNVLNTGVASAIGRLANLFLGNTRASTQHISAFVARMVDGCYIEKNEATDMHSMSSMAGAFTTNFGLHEGCSHQQIMAAFLDGVECGIERAAYWSRSGSGSRRKKTI